MCLAALSIVHTGLRWGLFLACAIPQVLVIIVSFTGTNFFLLVIVLFRSCSLEALPSLSGDQIFRAADALSGRPFVCPPDEV